MIAEIITSVIRSTVEFVKKHKPLFKEHFLKENLKNNLVASCKSYAICVLKIKVHATTIQ